jgi:hypothetical protein
MDTTLGAEVTVDAGSPGPARAARSLNLLIIRAR